jgi:hypothetical protein
MGLLGRKTKPEPTPELAPDLDESILSKRCPECFINLPLDAKECFSCHTRLGKPDKFGKAKRKPDWISYILCIVSWTIFILYIQWAFFSN